MSLYAKFGQTLLAKEDVNFLSHELIVHKITSPCTYLYVENILTNIYKHLPTTKAWTTTVIVYYLDELHFFKGKRSHVSRFFPFTFHHCKKNFPPLVFLRSTRMYVQHWGTIHGWQLGLHGHEIVLSNCLYLSLSVCRYYYIHYIFTRTSACSVTIIIIIIWLTWMWVYGHAERGWFALLMGWALLASVGINFVYYAGDRMMQERGGSVK